MNARLSDPEWRHAWEHGAPGEPQLSIDTTGESIAHAVPVAGVSGLRAMGVSVAVGASRLIDAVDLDLQPGEVGAVLGPNGAGKSTLLAVLAGLKKPDEGRVWLDGQLLAALSDQALACARAVLPQDTHVAFDFTVRDVVELGRYPHRLRPSCDEAGIVHEAMALADVGHLAYRAINSLSGGERARAQLARVLAQIWHPPANGQTRWLLLDEPTAALDLHHQHATLTTVRRWAHQQGVGVLAVLHDLNLALRYADRVWVLDRGRLQASGTPMQVLVPSLLQRVWQVQAQAVRDAEGCPQLLLGGLEGFSDSGRTPWM